MSGAARRSARRSPRQRSSTAAVTPLEASMVPDPEFGAAPRSFVGNLASLASGTLVYQGSRFALTIAAAAALGPDDFGLWSLLVVLVSYSGAFSLGIPNGAGREVPFLIGANREPTAADLEDSAWGAALVLGVLGAGVAAPLAAIVAGNRTEFMLIVAITMAAVFLQQPWLLLQFQLRSRLRFVAASVQLAIQGIVALGAGLISLPAGVIALWATQPLVAFTGVALGLRVLARRPRPRWRLADVRRLGSIGFPIMLAGLLFGLLSTSDRWFVAAALGESAVGHYGLVGLTVAGLLTIPSVISQQIYPQLSMALGQGVDRDRLLRRAAMAGAVSAVLLVAGALVLAAFALLAIPTLMPAYRSSVLPMLVVLPGVIIYGAGAAHGDLLNVLGNHWLYLRIQLLALALNVVLLVVFLVTGNGLTGAALATSVTFATYAVALVVAARWAPTRRGHEA